MPAKSIKKTQGKFTWEFKDTVLTVKCTACEKMRVRVLDKDADPMQEAKTAMSEHKNCAPTK